MAEVRNSTQGVLASVEKYIVPNLTHGDKVTKEFLGGGNVTDKNILESDEIL